MDPVFSARASFDLIPNRLSVALERARAEGHAVIDLTVSNPTQAEIPRKEEAILRALAQPASMTYEPSPFGLEAARQAVAVDLRADGVPVDPRRVALTASTSEAYAFLFKLLCDPGDEILVPRPSYPLFEHLARLESVRAIPYRLAYDGQWHLDAPSLRDATSARTRAVVTVSPNNPTGSYLKRDELDALASLGLPIISDEVFARYPLRPDARRVGSALETSRAPLVFALGGLSKLAALPQLKLAWVAVGGDSGHVAAALERLELIADAFLSLGTPVQHGLPALLEAGRTSQRAISERTRANFAWIVEASRGSPVTVLDAEGGWYATLRLPSTRSEEDWVLALIEDDGVYVHPGHFFDFESEPYVVVSLLAPEGAFREGGRRILARARKGG